MFLASSESFVHGVNGRLVVAGTGLDYPTTW